MAQQKVRADLIIRALAKRHDAAKDLFITEVKNGPTIYGEHRRMDAIAIKRSWAHPCITGYEVKVSRKDFERDDKWPGYRDMCHRLFFACPAGLVRPEELPGDVGLIWFNQEKRTIYTKRAAAFRDIEIPGQMLYYLLINRTDSDRHPFFNSRREFMEAWVEDREERKKLGFYVSNKMSKEIDDLKRQIWELNREVEKGKEAVAVLERVRVLVRQLGLYTGYAGYGWINELEQVIKAGIHPGLAQSVEAIDRELQRMKALIENSTIGKSTMGVVG
jgi:hypothetical protein